MGRQLVNSGAIEDGTNFFKKMVDAFFLVETRDVHWCRAIEQFMIPGLMWESLSRPSRLIPGTGRRHVLPGHKFILRTDDTMPERNEIEYMDQVFVLSEAQLMAIREKFEAIT